MKLKPSARINRRYILVESSSKDDIEKSILEYVGILGWAKMSPYIFEKNKKLIVAVDRKELQNAVAAFAISKKIKVLGISGTIKSLKKFKTETFN